MVIATAALTAILLAEDGLPELPWLHGGAGCGRTDVRPVEPLA